MLLGYQRLLRDWELLISLAPSEDDLLTLVNHMFRSLGREDATSHRSR